MSIFFHRNCLHFYTGGKKSILAHIIDHLVFDGYLQMQLNAPIIITITLDPVSHKYFTALRDIYFPKHCNYLEAHLTLFHHLPDGLSLVDDVLNQLCQRAALALEITGVKNIGNGAAFIITSEELQLIHKSMQQAFNKYLISQDRQKLWPHITVQNKVTAFKAKQTAGILQQNFEPFKIQGTGFSTWRYLKGPWQHLHHYPFNSAESHISS